MRNTKLFICGSGLVAVALAVAAFVLLPRPGSVRYHLQRLGDLRQTKFISRPSTLRDYFRRDTWLWYFHGRPSFDGNRATLDPSTALCLDIKHQWRGASQCGRWASRQS
jgi:hypothetical protein